MVLSHIVAAGKNRIIGRNNSLPWTVHGELKRFKEVTHGHTVIMGRKTYESLPGPLPNRRLIVLTRKPAQNSDTVLFRNTIEEAISLCQNETEVFIAGGGEVYQETFPLIDRVYLTRIDTTPDGDTEYPKYDPFQFDTLFIEKIDTAETGYTYYTLERKFRPYSKYLTQYLSETREIDFSHPLIQQKGEELKKNSHNTVDYIEKAFNYVRSLPHSADIDSRHVSVSASEVMQHNEGICYAKSHLLASLLRYTSIPAGFIYQKLGRVCTTGARLIIHALNAVYISDYNSWVPLDARGEKDPCPIDLKKGHLVYPPNTVCNECTIPAIYPAPDPASLNALYNTDDVENLLDNLPTELAAPKV